MTTPTEPRDNRTSLIARWLYNALVVALILEAVFYVFDDDPLSVVDLAWMTAVGFPIQALSYFAYGRDRAKRSGGRS